MTKSAFSQQTTYRDRPRQPIFLLLFWSHKLREEKFPKGIFRPREGCWTWPSIFLFKTILFKRRSGAMYFQNCWFTKLMRFHFWNKVDSGWFRCLRRLKIIEISHCWDYIFGPSVERRWFFVFKSREGRHPSIETDWLLGAMLSSVIFFCFVRSDAMNHYRLKHKFDRRLNI